MRIPKRLNRARSCFYRLPDDTSQKDLTAYEILYRARYPGVFKVRANSTFFFELPSTPARDAFLQSLHGSAKQAGLIVRRDILY